jgi:hypothetical protein
MVLFSRVKCDGLEWLSGLRLSLLLALDTLTTWKIVKMGWSGPSILNGWPKLDGVPQVTCCSIDLTNLETNQSVKIHLDPSLISL